MSTWIVISFDKVSQKFGFASDESEEVEQDWNPNYQYYLDQFEDGYDDAEYESIDDRLTRILIEDFNAGKVGRVGSSIHAIFGEDVVTNEVLTETARMWDRACVTEADDTSDTGTAKMYSRAPDTPDETPTEEFELVDEYEEEECKGERLEGRLAAAYMTFNYNFTVRGAKPIARNSDYSRVTQFEVRHRVAVEDPSLPLREPRDDSGIRQYVKNDYLLTEKYFADIEDAEEKADRITEQTGLETKVMSLPVKWNKATSEVTNEFDPKRFPYYDPIDRTHEKPFENLP